MAPNWLWMFVAGVALITTTVWTEEPSEALMKEATIVFHKKRGTPNAVECGKAKGLCQVPKKYCPAYYIGRNFYVTRARCLVSSKGVIDAPNQLTVLGPGVVNVTIGLHENFRKPKGPDVAWIKIEDPRLNKRKELTVAELFPKNCVRFHLEIVDSPSTDAHAHFRWIKQKSTPHPNAINKTTIKRIYSGTIAYKRPEPSTADVEHVVMCEARTGVSGVYELHYILFAIYDTGHTLDIDCHFAKCGTNDVSRMNIVTTPAPVVRYVYNYVYEYDYEYYYPNYTILINDPPTTPLPTTKKPNLVTSIKVFNPTTPEPDELIDWEPEILLGPIEAVKPPTKEIPTTPETPPTHPHPPAPKPEPSSNKTISLPPTTTPMPINESTTATLQVTQLPEKIPKYGNETELYTGRPNNFPFSISYIDDTNPEVITTPKEPVKHCVGCRRCHRCWQRRRLRYRHRRESPSSSAPSGISPGLCGAMRCATGSTLPPWIEPRTTMTPAVVQYLNPDQQRGRAYPDAASGDSC
ncbi:uncharacterized protein LOC134223517 [Armigeres subalbatus]|uniref:uncharacterized protein LOC134223517 n=1 Tax=Armigeres subalbatus TaxID=124917 RepID=UPI002ED311F6